MSLEQLSQRLLKSTEQTTDNLITELWSDRGPIVALLKGQFSIAAGHIIPEITLEFLQKITTIEQLNLIDNYLDSQQKLQTPAKDELKQLANLWGIKDTQAKTKVEIVKELLAVLLTNPANAKNLLELKKIGLRNTSMGFTNERLAKLAAGEYDDFFIFQETYGKNSIDNSKQVKETAENSEENSNGAEKTDYVVCNTIYEAHNDSSVSSLPKKIFSIISNVNTIANACYKINKIDNPELISLHRNNFLSDEIINSSLVNVQELMESTDNIHLQQLAFQVGQGLKNLASLFKLYSLLQSFSNDSQKPSSDINTSVLENLIQKQTVYLISELIIQTAPASIFKNSLDAESSNATTTNKPGLNLQTFTQILYSRAANPATLVNENAFLLKIIAVRKETIKETLNSIKANSELTKLFNNSYLAQKKSLQNLSRLKTRILNHNKSLIKQALPAKAWQEYLGLDNPVYLESVLDKLCQNATPADVAQFIKLADSHRNQTLPKFIRTLTKQDFSPNFFKDFMQAPEAVAIFNNDIAKLDQKLLKARNKVDRLQHPQPGLMDRLLGKEPKINKPKLENAKQTVSALTNARANLVAAPLEKRLNFMQKAIQFVPKLFKRLGAMLNPSQTSLTLPHPTLQRVTVSSLAELARLVDSNKIHQLSITQLLNLLDHRFLVTHASESTSPDNMLKIRTKIKIRVALKQRFNRHPNFFTSDLQAIYTLKILPITSREFFELITQHKDKRYVLRHISSDTLEQFFKDEKVSLSHKLYVAELLSQIKVHPTLCQYEIKDLRAQLIASPNQEGYQQAVAKNAVKPSKTVEFTHAPQGLLAKILTARGKKPAVNLVTIAEAHIKEQLTEASKNSSSDQQAQFYKDFCRGDLLIKTDGMMLTCHEGIDPVIMRNTKLALKEAYPSLIRNQAFQYFCNTYHQVMQNGSYALQEYLISQRLILTESFVNQISHLNTCRVITDKVLFKSEMVIAGFQTVNGNEIVDIPAPLKVSLAIEFKANSWKITNLTLDTYAENNDLLDSLAKLGKFKPSQVTIKDKKEVMENTPTPYPHFQKSLPRNSKPVKKVNKMDGFSYMNTSKNNLKM